MGIALKYKINFELQVEVTFWFLSAMTFDIYCLFTKTFIAVVLINFLLQNGEGLIMRGGGLFERGRGLIEDLRYAIAQN